MRQVFKFLVLATIGQSICLQQVTLAYDPLVGDFSKDDPLDVRIAAYNHAQNFIENPSTDAAFNRILIAINPDIISFEEFTLDVSEADVADRLNGILPIGGDGWQIRFGKFGSLRTVIASRYPLLLARLDTFPGSRTRGVTIALADLPDTDYVLDVYLMAVHLKCCGDPGGSEDASRQGSADAIANWMGDARGVTRSSGDNISLPANTPMIALGDFNLVGGPQPENTLITGDIQDEATYGVDVKGDWDNTDLTNLNPLDPFTGDNFTWQGSDFFDPSPLDRMFFTDSVMTVANSFVLNTQTMTSEALTNAGLQLSDTAPSSTSDHLPIVLDMRLPTPSCFNDADCSDGDFCNGAETCSIGNCLDGSPIDCDDNVACTIDSCNQATDVCDNIPSNGLCDNDLFCDGAETCMDGGCQSSSDPCLGQGLICDEVNDECDCNDSVDCQDELFCTGVETCVDGVCQSSGDPCIGQGLVCDEVNDECDCDDAVDCDDGIFCNGQEQCVEGTCLAGSDSCPAQPCDESNDKCVDCLDDADCDDADACTQDVCESDACRHDLLERCSDRDSDGIADDRDICPETPPAATANNQGCSCDQLDEDRDALDNCQDRCPGTAQGQEVDSDGCAAAQLDDDRDGISNDIDLCPDTQIDLIADRVGCAVGQQEDEIQAGAILPQDGDGAARNGSGCGACGPIGLINIFALVVFGFAVRLRRRPFDFLG